MWKKVIIPTSILLIITLLMCFGTMDAMDTKIYEMLTSKPFDGFSNLSYCISFLASSKGLLILTFIFIFLLPSNKERKYLLFDLLISACAITISKNIFLRNRPLLGQELLPGSYSYPSGHSFVAVTYFGFLLYLLSKNKILPNVKMVGSVFLSLLIIFIPLSRLTLGVHYLSDVIAGVLFGYVFLQILIYFYEKSKSPKEKPLLNTFSYAISGIVTTIKEERNMIIHLMIMILVVLASYIFQISRMEFIICLLLIGLIFALELINTAIENVVDLVTLEHNEKARKAKDVAAGAVLIMSVFAALIGLIIFLPKIL